MTTAVDGRRLRRAQNRDAVLEAMGALFAEGSYQPNVGEIAERAGLSPRSLFRYFDDLDDLVGAAIEHHLYRARPLLVLEIGGDSSTAAKIDHLVARRVALFEATAPAARAARACAHRQPVVAAQVARARSYLRHQVARLLAPELAGPAGAHLPAIDALCSFETYELLRGAHGLSRARTIEAMTGALRALLEAEPVRP